MRLTFDPAFGSPAWPGPLGPPGSGREAVLGEAWVGPMQLFGIVEKALGIDKPHASPAERAASLIAAVRATSFTPKGDGSPRTPTSSRRRRATSTSSASCICR